MAAIVASDFTCAVERHPVGYDLADETDLLRFGCTDVAPGEEQVGRDRVRDLPAQPHDRTPEGIQPPTHLGHTEPSALTGDTYVCCLKDLGAARDRGPSTAAMSGLSRRKPFSNGLITPPDRSDVVSLSRSANTSPG